MNYSIHQPRSVSLQNCSWIKDCPSRISVILGEKKKLLRGHKLILEVTDPRLFRLAQISSYKRLYVCDQLQSHVTLVSLWQLQVWRLCGLAFNRLARCLWQGSESCDSVEMRLLCNFHYWRAQEKLIPLHPAIWVWDLAKYACVHLCMRACMCVCDIIGPYQGFIRCILKKQIYRYRIYV